MWFEQTTLNIGILYTVGNDFSPRLTIWGCYLEIRHRLAGINCQSFDSSSRKTCFEIRPLSSRVEDTNTMRRLKGTCGDLEPPSKLAREGISPRLYRGLTWAVDHHCRRHLSGWEATLPPIVVVWSPSYRAWCSVMAKAMWSWGTLDVRRERES